MLILFIVDFTHCYNEFPLICTLLISYAVIDLSRVICLLVNLSASLNIQRMGIGYVKIQARQRRYLQVIGTSRI